MSGMKGIALLIAGLLAALVSPLFLKAPITARAMFTLPAPVVSAVASKEKITVSWNAITGATGYHIFRYTSGGAGHFLYQTVATTSYDDLDVVNGRAQSYYVTAFNATEGSFQSNYAVATCDIGPATLTSDSGKASVILNWNSVTDADTYNVYRFQGGFWSQIASGVSGTTHTDGSRTNGNSYTYMVRGVNGAGPGQQSNNSTSPVYLPAPDPVSADRNPGTGVVTLSWGAVTWADSYQVYRATASGGFMNYHGATAATTYNAGTVPGGTTYYYIVYAVNTGGQSPRSKEVSSTGLPYSGANPPHEGQCPMDPDDDGCEMCPDTGSIPISRAQSMGAGALAGDPVNLAKGTEIYAPLVDIAAYNPNGPTAIFQRNYRSNQARVGYYSPGLSPGWVHNYDARIVPSTSSSVWDPLTLVYANGAVETLTPTLSGGGTPTGAFSYTNGLPYLVTGTASGTTNQWTAIEMTWRDQTKWKFELHATGQYVLTRITNRMGKSIDIAYDSLRRLDTVTDTTSSVGLLDLTYGTNGVLEKIDDAYSRKVIFGSTFTNGAFVLTSRSVIAAAANPAPPNRATYGYAQYDQRYYLTTITVPSPTGTGTETGTIYYNGSTGFVTSRVDANGNKREYTYSSGTTTVTLKNASNVTLLTWNQNYSGGWRDTGTTDSAGKSNVVEYLDANNPAKPTKIENANGREELYTYDSKGNVLTTTNSRGVVTTYTWDYTSFFFGRLTSIQVAGKPATTITYFEPSGLIDTVTTTLPGGVVGTAATSYTYDALGNVLTVTTPGNNAVGSMTTTYNYTSDGGYSQSAALGQALTSTNNLGHVSHSRYDAQGRLVSAWDALGNTTDTTYDLAGAPLTVVSPATAQTGGGRGYTEHTYLYVGGPLTSSKVYDESNSLVRTTTTAYGKDGEVLGVSGNIESATYTYDGAYRIKTVADGLGQTTTYTYNARGQVSQIAYPGGDTAQFTSFDDAGNPLTRVDGNSVTTNYVYNDDEDKLTEIQYPATPSLNVEYTYDAYGRQDSMTDPTGVTTYVYGDLDEMLSKTTTFTGLSAKVISYGYYADGSRSSMTTPAGSFAYSYDGAGRMTSLTNPFSETSSWTYLNNDWLLTQTLGNGTVATYSYNALGQLLGLENRTSGGTLRSSFDTATYDGVGNMKSITASVPAMAAYSGLTSWNFDAKDQLTLEQSARLSGYTNTFGYDAAGNLTTFKGASRTYNNRNQLTAVGFAYDGNGNPTTYGGNTLTFDPEDRMTAFGTVMTAGYDGDGLRAWKQNSTTLTYFLFDGQTPICELDVSGNVSAADTWGANGLLSRRVSSATTYYTFDQRGATAQRLDSSQAILTSNAFDAFGVSAVSPADPHDGLGGQYGYYWDSETSLQLLTHRYYDAQTGRFLTRDPLGYGGGVNLYAYTRSNPTNKIDPTGLTCVELAIDPLDFLDLFDFDKNRHTTGDEAVSAINNWNKIANPLRDRTVRNESWWKKAIKAGDYEVHHVLPKAFRHDFDRVLGPNVWNNMLMKMPKEFHRKLHSGSFGSRGGWYNSQWKKFFNTYKNPTPKQVFTHLREMLDEAGLGDVTWSGLHKCL